MIEHKLVQHIRAQLALDWHGIHGAPHCARVRVTGLRLAESTGVRAQVVELFAFLHDARRQNGHRDPQHGDRAAAFAQTLVGEYFDLASDDLLLLQTACRRRCDGRPMGDITVLT